MTLAEEIKRLIEGDVDDSTDTLTKYSTDASLFYVRPQVIVFPKSTNDVRNIVRFAAEEKKHGRDISLTGRSAGTDMTGGPLSESIVLSFTRYMNRLLELGDDYAVVEPGMYYRDFEARTIKKNLLLPSYPASRELCCMGGIVANNSGGEKTLKYGKTERYVDTVWMVCEDGEERAFSKLSGEQLQQKMQRQDFEGNLYRQMHGLIAQNREKIAKAKPDVTKNSAGYYLWNVYDWQADTFDLAKLITGSQGTLGIITKAKFKLVHPQKYSKLLIIFLKDMQLVSRVSEAVLPLNPESFETYDDNTFKLAMRFFPELLHQIKAGFLKVMLRTWPEFLMLAEGGIPKLVLLAEFTADNPRSAGAAAEKAKKLLREKLGKRVKLRVTHSKEETEEFWVIRRDSFNLLRKHMRGLRTAPFIDDFSVRAERLPEFLPKLYQIMSRYKLIYTIAGHLGDGNFHIIPLMNLADPKAKDTIQQLSQEVYGLILQFHGTITSEHNDGLIRTPFLEQMYGKEICDLFAKTKRIFDPLNLFNPGKKVPVPGGGGTFAYAREHINTRR